jgi:glycosyltransferase involved in cell wall biosynthesis
MNTDNFLKLYQKKPVIEYPNGVINSVPNPLISCLIITYQHANYIKECLESVLIQQTDFPFEIIIVEDESSDETRTICVEYAKKYPDRIRLFLNSRKNNISINGYPTGRFNMIYGVAMCRGKYIAFCEGDDYWTHPYKLQMQADILNQYKDIIACHHWHKYLINGAINNASTDGYYPYRIASVKEIFENKLRVKSRTIMFRNITDNNFFPDWFYKVAFGDVPLSMLLGQHGKFYFIDKPMAIYRITNKGVSTAGKSKMNTHEWKIKHLENWIKIWQYADEHYEKKYHKEASQTILYFLNEIRKNKEYLQMIKNG